MGVLAKVKTWLGVDESFDDDVDIEDLPPGAPSEPRRKRGILHAFPTIKNKNIFVTLPQTQSDATVAADYLKSGSAVFVNLQSVEPEAGQRIVDVISGVCYGVDGFVLKVGKSMFLFVPHDFSIVPDERTHLEAGALFMENDPLI